LQDPKISQKLFDWHKINQSQRSQYQEIILKTMLLKATYSNSKEKTLENPSRDEKRSFRDAKLKHESMKSEVDHVFIQRQDVSTYDDKIKYEPKIDHWKILAEKVTKNLNHESPNFDMEVLKLAKEFSNDVNKSTYGKQYHNNKQVLPSNPKSPIGSIAPITSRTDDELIDFFVIEIRNQYLSKKVEEQINNYRYDSKGTTYKDRVSKFVSGEVVNDFIDNLVIPN